MVIKRLAAVGAFFLIGFLVIDFFVPNRELLLALRVLQAAMCVTVMYVYWPDFIRSLTEKEASKGDYLIIGITLSQFAIFCQAAIGVLFRLSGSPGWLINADVNGMFILVSVLSGAMHVLAPEAIGGTVPRRSRIAAGMGLGVSVALVLLFSIGRPDIAPAMERVRPYMQDWFGNNAVFDPYKISSPPGGSVG